jgi:uncharacterized protein YcbK (DUF882 family)
MKPNDWTKIKHFRPEEWRQDASKVDWGLVRAMDRLRELVGAPIIIHEAWAVSGHGENSLHYSGKAVDFHVAGNRPFAEDLLCVLSIPEFLGVGWYPEWKHPGFHVDIRKADTRLLWVREKGIYHYGQTSWPGP